VYHEGVAYKMIKVDDQTHARLATLAEEKGTTIGGLVGELAVTRPTKAERDAMLARIEARFGRPDPESLARVAGLLDDDAAGSRNSAA
jgi:hypothetical protein